MKKIGIRPAEWRFSLRGVLVFVSSVGALLGISRLVHPMWVILSFAYVLLVYGFCRSTIRRTIWIPLVPVTVHTLLITVAAVIHSLSAWDDMNPTMLIMIAIYFLDYPIHYVFRLLGVFPSQIGLWYAAQLVVTGGLLWFGVGLLMKMALSSLASVLPGRE